MPDWSVIITFLPFIFFGMPLLVIFGFFVSGAFALFFSEDSERGKDAIAKALTYFIILLALFVVFIAVSYFVKQGEVFKREESKTGFPSSPMGKFPSVPQFIVVGEHSFSGPWPIAEKNNVTSTTIYTVFCKKEQGYDILDIGEAYERKPVSSSHNYKCWLENCQNNAGNIYVGFFWTPLRDSYPHRKYLEDIKKNVEFICQQ